MSQRFNLAAVPLLGNKFSSLVVQSVDYATGYHWNLYSPFVVFPGYRVVFLAVPRTGTTSLRYALTPLLGNGLNLGMPRYRHTFSHYMNNCSRRAVAEKYTDCFKFTFVRNPWTRLYSCYLAKVRSKSNRHFKHLGLDRCKTFEEFALRVCDIPDERADPHFMSQDGLLSYRGKFLPDQVYRFEAYTEHWREVKGRIEGQTGIELHDIPHYYKMESDEYRQAYSTALVERVGERYRADCERFGYAYPG